MFISPWIIGFLVFTAGPMIASLVLSFTDYSLVSDADGVGTENYEQLVSDPRVAQLAEQHVRLRGCSTCRWARSSALLLGMLLHRVGRAAGFFRTVFYLPMMTPAVAAGAMFLLLLNGQHGLVNQVLGWVGIEGPHWTTDPHVGEAVARHGEPLGRRRHVVIFLAALKNVPGQLYEAAALDGAGAGAPVLLRSPLPMISGAMFFNVIMHTIAALQMFDQAYTMFFGPSRRRRRRRTSLFYMVYLFQQAFQFFNFGFASAMAWLLFVIILVVTVIQVRVGQPVRLLRRGARAMTDVQAPAPRDHPGHGRLRRHPDPAPAGGRSAAAPRGWGRRCYLLALLVAVLVFVYPLVWLVARR